MFEGVMVIPFLTEINSPAKEKRTLEADSRYYSFPGSHSLES
jgi:hypothetical protein